MRNQVAKPVAYLRIGHCSRLFGYVARTEWAAAQASRKTCSADGRSCRIGAERTNHAHVCSAAHWDCRRWPFRPLPRAEGRGVGTRDAGGRVRRRRRTRRNGRMGGRRAHSQSFRSALRQRRADDRCARRGAPCAGDAGAACGQACAGGKADRRHAGPGRRTCRRRFSAQPGVAGRPSGTFFRRLCRHGGTARCTALYRGDAHCAVQAARHRRVGDPRPDDPRPRPDSVACGQ